MSGSSEALSAGVASLSGVTDDATAVLGETLEIETVGELAESRHFTFAAEIIEAVADPGHLLRQYGIPRGRVVEAFEDRTVDELVGAPLSALAGIGVEGERQLAEALEVRTLDAFASWPPFHRAREILADAMREGLVSGEPKVFRVYGLVVRSDSTPVDGAGVKVEREGIVTPLPLGSVSGVTTNANGGCIFEYDRPDAPVDLRIEVLADSSIGVGETRPRVISQAGPEERADFVTGDEALRGSSTFDRLERAVDQALAEEDLEPADIADFDAETLARLALRTGVDPRTMALLRQSHALAGDTGLSAAVLFGMGREKMPLGLPALLVQGSDQRRAAVEAALAANHIPARLEDDAARALAHLDDLSVAAALEQPVTPDVTTLGSLLDEADVPAAKRKGLADAYVAHAATNEEFWNAVGTAGVLTAAEIGRLQFTLQLATVTQNHAPLVAALRACGITELKGLASLSEADWLDLVTGDGSPPAGVPADLKAAGVSNQGYAEMVFRTAEDALATAMVAERIDDFPDGAALKRFFEGNPGFDVRTTPVRAYLDDHPDALDFAANAAERQDLERRLKGLERTYRVARPGARVETMRVLLEEGLDSAQKIRGLGRAAFLRRFEAALGRERAEKVWTRANNASALATTVVARHSAAFDRTPMYALPRRAEAVSKLPSYEALFGSLDFCSCEHCQSVFGPAAYLVDVLNWLDNREPQSGKTALDVLFDERRSDLGGIELSCTNTNTALPYIDLVNEALEVTVAPVTPPPAYQTTGSPADLRAHPEHLHRGAYEVLAGARAANPDGEDAVYPFSLPFNLWIEEARTYLARLGVPRYQLMEAFHGREVARTDPVVAAETLAMSPLEWDIIAGKPLDPPRSVAEFWGLPGDADAADTLKRVAVLLDHATPPIAEHGTGFDELADLLRADFVQAPATIGVWFEGRSCDTSKAQLVGLTEAGLERMHRLVRLRRRLGWSTSDLDRTIQVLGGGTLDEACLLKIAHVWRLAAQLRRPVAELLGWWGPLDTRRWTGRLKPGVPAGAPTGVDGFGMVFDNLLAPQPTEGADASAYERLFQPASTSAEPTMVFGVNADGSALGDESKHLTHHLPAIAGALGVTAEDLAELMPRLPNGLLSLSNLSALHRHVSLARAVDLRIRELVSLITLVGVDPFDVARTADALAFLDELSDVRRSGVSVAELDYVLRHRDTKPAGLEPDDIDIGVLFFELGAALRRIEADHPLPDGSATLDELRARLVAELATLLATDDAGEALAIVDVEAGSPPPQGVQSFIAAKLAGIFDPADAIKRLVEQCGDAYLSDRRDRLAYALTVVVTHRRHTDKASAVIERMSAAVGLDHAITAPLVRHLRHPDASGDPLLAVFSDDPVRGHHVLEEGSGQPVLPGPADLPEQFAGYKRLHKAAILLNRLRISTEELAWVLEHGPASGTVDFQALPVTANAPAAPYPGWARLRDAAVLRDGFSPNELFDLFEAAAAADADGTPPVITAAHEALLTELERRSRWDRADLDFLVGTPAQPGALGFTYQGDWTDERPLKRLGEVMLAVRRFGLPVETLWPWRDIPLPANGTPGAQRDAIDRQAAQAEEIVQAVRARHDEAQWYEVAPMLRDRVRERQRDALVGWLVANDPRFTDANALLEHLLLDVEMSSCQLTSRIRQAISAAQLFVQRSLMGLEVDHNGHPRVALSTADADEWEWMKNYRVWEANRKVFLYPENWIEPELRDDKTPFFKELEDELLRSEVTADSAERAVRGYLEKLDQVARLEVVGLCQHKQGDILHVFGRIRGTPPIYYHRQRINGSHWTPWEKVDVDIEGDHVIPYVFNRRLYLFWPLITESAAEEPQDIPDVSSLPKKVAEPNRYYQIRLAWTQRRKEGWTSKKIARAFISQDVFGQSPHEDASDEKGHRVKASDIQKTARSAPADFSFQAFEEDGDLIIAPLRTFRPSREPARYIVLPQFRMSGNDGTVTLEAPEVGKPIVVRTPPGTRSVNQAIVRTSGTQQLDLPARNPVTGADGHEPTLKGAAPPFEIVPLDLVDFVSREPFFFQDRRRTFFVEPRASAVPWVRKVADGTVAANAALDTFGNTTGTAPRPHPPTPNPWIYDPSAVATLPDAITAVTPAEASDSSDGRLGLAALNRETLEETFGPRVAYVAGAAVHPGTSNLTLGVNARIVDANGRELAAARSGMPPADAADLEAIVVSRTFQMPALHVDAVVMAPPLKPSPGMRYRFDTFYHPYLSTMISQLNRFDLDGLFDPSPAGPEPELRRQRKAGEFFGSYAALAVLKPFPEDEFDFSFGGSYAIYNWELFFHVPFLIACHLSKNHRFAEAQRWFHYIFDPTATDGDAPQRFWKVRPLFELFNDEHADAGPIHELLLLLQYEGTEPEKLRQRDELIEQVAEWRSNPFNPHALARLRLTAYARSVVMKYIDNLIAWGDQLFRRDTMESINEATQLYVMAAQLLGRRPRRVDVEASEPATFNELRGNLDPFSSAVVEEVEGFLPEITDTKAEVYHDDVAVLGPTRLFCVPPNDKLLTDYWDRVADRLFKIRRCMTIEGVVRQLPLFEPPIDPALLVRAKALGVDLASALSDLNAPVPLYRYQVLAQKATELCADVRGLGQALLSTLEKKDAEELALLRSGHEVRLQGALLDIREQQIRDARETLESLRRSKENAEIRRDYYRSRQYMNTAEIAQFGSLATAGLLDTTAQGIQAVGSILGAVPNVDTGTSGFGGSPVVTFNFGGLQLSLSAEAASSSLRISAAIADRVAQLSGLIGSYERRRDDWGMQSGTAEKDIEVLDRQIVAAEIRVAIAERELENLKLQLAQSKEAEEFLRGKYTNAQLYHWMAGQLSGLYFQSYQLAYDMAKRAERAWQVELAGTDKGFIQFGYWDSLKKGLLAGERLHHDLKRMELAYLDANKREYELSRHVSLLELDPMALLQLRRQGRCSFTVPEEWFDLEGPGHYLRRIKTVAVSVPSVTGPYTPVRCTLTLHKSSTRISPALSNGDYARQSSDDNRFIDDLATIQSIVTSSGSNDAGMFDANLRDERYLPFENTGVISEWQLELPANPAEGDPSLFDYDTISDVILHISYTAREGGAPLRRAAMDHVKALIKDAQAAGQVRLFSLRHDFPAEWAKFQSQTPADNERFGLALTLRKEHYPFWSQARLNRVLAVHLLARSTEEPVPDSMTVTDRSDKNDATANTDTLTKDPSLGNLLVGKLSNIELAAQPVGELQFFFDTKALADLWIAVNWSE